MHGFLNIDKPAGLTSFDVVRRIRRAAGLRRVGHAGTLDPVATGVLPVALGQATKLVQELMHAAKRYRGVITLGVETDTYDCAGEVVARADASAVTAQAVERALDAFRGEQTQTPPAYSAVKRAGVPAYKAARSGKPHALDPRPVTVHSIRTHRNHVARADDRRAVQQGLLHARPGAGSRPRSGTRRSSQCAAAHGGGPLPRGGRHPAGGGAGAVGAGRHRDAAARSPTRCWKTGRRCYWSAAPRSTLVTDGTFVRSRGRSAGPAATASARAATGPTDGWWRCSRRA